MKNPTYKKFENRSMHVSKFMLCIKKRDEWMDKWMDGQKTHKQYAPPTFSKLGGIKIKDCKAKGFDLEDKE